MAVNVPNQIVKLQVLKPVINRISAQERAIILLVKIVPTAIQVHIKES